MTPEPERTTAGAVGLAQMIATRAHDGQFRRDGITPYIEHPKAVAARVGPDEEAQAVAWLHDVLEDTKLEADALELLGFSRNIVDAVVALTKMDGEGYYTYLCRVGACSLASRVKIADILHNLSDSPTDRQIVKYAKALLFLMPSPRSLP